MSRKTSLREKLIARTRKVGVILLFTLLTTGFCFLTAQLLPQDFSNELFYGRSGDKLFKIFLLDPIPNSVTILHSQDDGGFGDYILLHFKISPDDFNLILASKKWEIRRSRSFCSGKFRLVLIIGVFSFLKRYPASIFCIFSGLGLFPFISTKSFLTGSLLAYA